MKFASGWLRAVVHSPFKSRAIDARLIKSRTIQINISVVYQGGSFQARNDSVIKYSGDMTSYVQKSDLRKLHESPDRAQMEYLCRIFHKI
jgi:hypothetical protein